MLSVASFGTGVTGPGVLPAQARLGASNTPTIIATAVIILLAIFKVLPFRGCVGWGGQILPSTTLTYFTRFYKLKKYPLVWVLGWALGCKALAPTRGVLAADSKVNRLVKKVVFVDGHDDRQLARTVALDVRIDDMPLTLAQFTARPVVCGRSV